MRYLLAVLLLSVCVSAQTHGTDGSWWKRESPEAKLAYVSGYLSGAMTAQTESMGTCAALWALAKPIKDAYPMEQWQKICFPLSLFDVGTIEQFRDGANVFYSDFRNQQIGFDSAMKYVADEIRGKPRAEQDAKLEHLRKCAADYTTCFANPEKPAK